MKYLAKTISSLLLGSTLFIATVPAFAQTADTNPPPPPEDMASGPDDQGADDGWGWGRRHGKGRNGGMHEGRKGGGHGRGAPMMIVDTNADGVIGADEAAALADGFFMRADQNRDEVIDKAEFTTPPGHGRWQGWFSGNSAEAAAVLKVREEKFATLDADKDGKVNKVEFFAAAQQRLASADADKDGKVTPWEFRAFPRM